MSEEQQSTETPPVSKDEQTWAMACHLAALAGILIPFGNIFGPLIVWLMKRAEMPAVDVQGKESLNFQITVTIALIVCILLMFVVIGIVLAPIVGIGALILTIMAAVKVSNGELGYRYPWTFRFLK